MRFFVALLILACIFTGALAEDIQVDFTELTLDQLNTFSDDIDAEIKLHHKPDSDTKSAVLSATQNVVESYFDEQGIEISWAWIDYEYNREWDFYTLSTHIDYRDAADEKHKPDVYAELFPENGEYAVYYLLVGTEVLINRREDLPDVLWAEEPRGIINKATNTNLSKVPVEELNALKEAIVEEIDTNHSTNSTTSSLVLSLAKQEVENYFSQQDMEVSWAWFDYDYTCDWEFYTLTTPIDYRDTNNEYHESTVYAEAYPISGQYSLSFLAIDDAVLIDHRNELPDNLSAALTSIFETADEKSETTSEPTTTPEPTATPAPTATQPATVSYSTNDMSTVKNGNSGIYAYRSRGGQYYIYWIIDFNDSYVYYFTEGNGEESCDRVKIDSGNLNDVLIITYHDGGDEWSYGLHFKWKNQPDILIVQDNDGFEYDYSTTNLKNALQIRDNKTIRDY